MPRLASLLCCGLLALATGCDDSLMPPVPPAPQPQSLDAQLRQSLERWSVMPIGPMPAQDPALVDLGQALMFDKILSGNRDISCATCHHPATHTADGLALAIGTGGSGLGPSRTLGPGRLFVPRSSPSLLNGGLGLFYMFWDGRLARLGPGPFLEGDPVFIPGLPDLLTAQAMLPVTNRREMRGEQGDLDRFGNPNELAQLGDSALVDIWRAVMGRLLAIPGYVAKFNAAFPGTPTTALRFEQAATAIAAFQRQAFTRTNSPFDRYLGRDDAALSTVEKRGALLFFGRAGCAGCHGGPFLGGQSFDNNGAPQLGPGTGPEAPLDLGRGNLAGQEFYRFAFRAPPLRNVELTAPYLHNGAYPSLEAVVRHYSNVPLALQTYDVAQLPPALRSSYRGDVATISDVLASLAFQLQRPLNLTDGEQHDLVAFLKALTDPAARNLGGLVPATVPSGLPVE